MRAITALALLAFVAAAAAQAEAQDVSAEPTYGDVSLSAGFTPDPHHIELTAGGSNAINKGDCSYGNAADAPDVDLYWESSGVTLYIYVIGDDDTTLLVNTPNANWLCDDDSYGDGDPIVMIPNASAGLYDIWVGTYGEDMVSATLYISEIDPRQAPEAPFFRW